MKLRHLLNVLISLFLIPSADAQLIIDTVAGGNGPNGIQATVGGIGNPTSVAVDASGNFYIADQTKNVSPDQLFSPGITGILRPTVGGAVGFEERRIGERYKLALPVQLNDGTGTTCDINTSVIFFETESAHSIGDTIGFS